MKHRCLSILLAANGLSAAAQTIFIPDTNVRDWLNAAKPNSVDALGNCDTAVWNAQPPFTVGAVLQQLPNGTVVDLEGVQHLKIREFYFQNGLSNAVSLNWPGYPIGMTHLDLRFVDVGLFTGAFQPLASSVYEVLCQNCGFGMLPAFSGAHLYFYDEDMGGQVLVVPPNVTELTMDDCNLSQLPAMPNVVELDVDDNPLGALPALPAGLQLLTAKNTGLTSMPPLPSGLQHLGLDNNQLTVLPNLPAGLLTLGVARNQLTALPALPASLSGLNVSFNPMPVLPVLGNAMQELYVDSCGMSVINYPFALLKLSARFNPISVLPPFGSQLYYCDVQSCAQLTCLPPLYDDLAWLRLAGSGVTCIPNIPPALVPGLNNIGIPPVVCNIGTSPCPIVDPLVTGTTFNDANTDGIFDVGEAVRPNSIVEAQPGDLLAGSDINGNYVLPANVGSFSVAGVPGLYEPVTTAPYAVTFTGIGQVDSLNHIGFNVIPGMYDLVTTITATNVRPGFNTGVWVNVHNVGTEPTTATVQLTFDAALSYVSSSVVPDAVNGNVVDWTTPVIVPGGSWTVWVELYGPPALVLGSPVVQQATATPSQPDQTPVDNTYVLNDVVVGSFDPNDKRVEPSTLSLLDVASGTRVHYTVRFQNTGTFPAERVLITDTLSTDLYWTTINVEAASHEHTWYLHNGVLHVLFEDINLPDSVSDEPGSHGFVKFSFVPSSSLVVGSAVGNVANIYFDFNEPVITNDAVFYVETSLAVEGRSNGGLRVWPNPADDVLYISSEQAVSGSLTVLDITGRVVLSQPTNGVRSTVHVDALAPGPYVVHCTAAAGTQVVHFVKH